MIEAIGEKLAQGGRLDRDELVSLWDTKDLVRLGMLGDDARRRRHGAATTFVRVASIPAADVSRAAIDANAGEVQVTGTLDELRSRLDDVRALVDRAAGVPVTVGSLEDLVSAGHAGDNILDRLRAAGVYAVASAAVDVLPSPVLAVRAALDAGLRIARFVVRRSTAEPLDMLERVYEIQRATQAIHAFAPIPREQDPARPTTGYRDTKVIVISRLALDNVADIQVDWSLLGPKLSQVGLLFGANDIDAVPVDEGTAGARRAPVEEVRRNIRAASLEPVERDGRGTVRTHTGA